MFQDEDVAPSSKNEVKKKEKVSRRGFIVAGFKQGVDSESRWMDRLLRLRVVSIQQVNYRRQAVLKEGAREADGSVLSEREGHDV